MLERIAQKIRLNKCEKCRCLRIRHDLETGRCRDCACVNTRVRPEQKGMDLGRLFDLDGGTA